MVAAEIGRVVLGRGYSSLWLRSRAAFRIVY